MSLLAAGLLLAPAASTQAQFATNTVWSDEFDYSGLPDSSKWAYETGGGGWGNNELQNYTTRWQNARATNGTLVVNALREDYGGNAYTSARLHSHGAGDWTYGRVMVRSRFTGAPGAWPAIWMLPTDWVYGGWPNSGEIDIMEHVVTHGESVQASVHTQAYNHMLGTQKYAIQPGIDYYNWHTYTLEWFPHRIDVWVDGIRYFSFRDEYAGSPKWPFDQRFHLMLNLAVGGWGGPPNFTNETLEIDHVRVYPYTGQSQVAVHPQAWYRLVNRHSGKVLDVAGPSVADGANIHQWDWASGHNQQWRLEPGGDGACKLIARHSGKACEVAGSSWANGANVQQYATNGTPAQEWWVQPAGDGYCRLVNRDTGRVLDVADSSTANGGNAQQWNYVGGANQQWRVEQVVAPPSPPTPTGLRAAPGGAQITLFWNVGANTTSYNLKRATTSGGPYTVVAAGLTNPVCSDTGLSAGRAYYYVVSAMNGTTGSADSSEVGAIPWTVLQAVNGGGGAAAPFSADAYFSGGTAAATAAVVDTANLTNPAPQAVYQSERYGNMTYTLPGLTPDATYRVRLHFAETYWSAAGQRRFNVSINGAPVLSNFDIFAAAGGKNKAVIREFNAAANASGRLIVQFTTVTDNAKVSGIELIQAPVVIPPLLAVARSGNDFELLWPSSATAFGLYSTTALMPPVVWSPVTNTPMPAGTNLSVTLPVTNGARFFRLAAPFP